MLPNTDLTPAPNGMDHHHMGHRHIGLVAALGALAFLLQMVQACTEAHAEARQAPDSVDTIESVRWAGPRASRAKPEPQHCPSGEVWLQRSRSSGACAAACVADGDCLPGETCMVRLLSGEMVTATRAQREPQPDPTDTAAEPVCEGECSPYKTVASRQGPRLGICTPPYEPVIEADDQSIPDIE